MKNIVILGGGTAGWLTAIYCIKTFPKDNILLIESDKIGILGAGEGSTPRLIQFLNDYDVDVIDLIKNTKSTIKNGISFENWNGDGKKYFHGFGVTNNFNLKNYDDYLNCLVSNKKDLNNYDYTSVVSYQNKIDLNNIVTALHFDAKLLADYLKNICIRKGVKHLLGEFDDISLKNCGNIKEIIISSKKILCDFVFDCSGFARLIIGKHFKSNWIDYQKHLPIKKAIPFFLKNEEELKPYTQAIAMKYGWVWKIPLQHRIGAGYIFDSNYITDEQAFAEAKKIFSDIEYTRTINFTAGCFDKVWIKNCIAIGLSSGFTEPLEATSIWSLLSQLYLLDKFLPKIQNVTENKIKKYNNIVLNNNKNILNFLHLHYLTKRNDTDFWKNFHLKNKLPEKLKSIRNKLKILNLNRFSKNDYNYKNTNLYWEPKSYITVLNGLNYVDYFQCNKVDININDYFKKMSSNKNISHKQFLKDIK